MRLVLPAKSCFDDALVQRVWDRIDEHVSEQEAKNRVDAAAEEVAEVVGRYRDQVVYGWSGGKDSLALQVVMERAGIERSVCGIVGHLEFPDHIRWLKRHAPARCEIISNNDLDAAWLARPENRRYLFPSTSKDGYFWTLAGTRRAQHEYQQRHHPRLQIYGRRTQDNNHIGQGPYGIYRARGVTQYAPIRGWQHEMVLAAVAYFWLGTVGDELPPIYRYPQGWSTGTGPWPGRRVNGGGDERAGWENTYDCDPTVVRRAARHFAEAARTIRDREG